MKIELTVEAKLIINLQLAINSFNHSTLNLKLKKFLVLIRLLPTHSLPAKSTSCSLVLTLCLPLVEEPFVRVGEGDLDRAAAVPGAGDLGRI